MTDSIYNDPTCGNCNQLERWCDCGNFFPKKELKGKEKKFKNRLNNMLKKTDYVKMYRSAGEFYIEATTRKKKEYFYVHGVHLGHTVDRVTGIAEKIDAGE